MSPWKLYVPCQIGISLSSLLPSLALVFSLCSISCSIYFLFPISCSIFYFFPVSFSIFSHLSLCCFPFFPSLSLFFSHLLLYFSLFPSLFLLFSPISCSTFFFFPSLALFYFFPSLALFSTFFPSLSLFFPVFSLLLHLLLRLFSVHSTSNFPKQVNNTHQTPNMSSLCSGDISSQFSGQRLYLNHYFLETFLAGPRFISA